MLMDTFILNLYLKAYTNKKAYDVYVTKEASFYPLLNKVLKLAKRRPDIYKLLKTDGFYGAVDLFNNKKINDKQLRFLVDIMPFFRGMPNKRFPIDVDGITANGVPIKRILKSKVTGVPLKWHGSSNRRDGLGVILDQGKLDSRQVALSNIYKNGNN